MSSVYNFTFDNLTRYSDDKCYVTERERQNSQYGSYSVQNYFSNDCGLKKPMNFALSQPNVFVNGGYGNSGAGGCNIDSDSNMKIGTIQTNPKCRISLQTRPFTTVPFLGRGVSRPVEESRLQQGDWVTNKKSCSTITETPYFNHQNYPLVPSLQATIQNPSNLVEGVASDGWVQGGLPTRDLIRDQDYMNRYN
jgi:hypothetical protein